MPTVFETHASEHMPRDPSDNTVPPNSIIIQSPPAPPTSCWHFALNALQPELIPFCICCLNYICTLSTNLARQTLCTHGRRVLFTSTGLHLVIVVDCIVFDIQHRDAWGNVLEHLHKPPLCRPHVTLLSDDLKIQTTSALELRLTLLADGLNTILIPAWGCHRCVVHEFWRWHFRLGEGHYGRDGARLHKMSRSIASPHIT
jgi:hypothetical protein